MTSMNLFITRDYTSIHDYESVLVVNRCMIPGHYIVAQDYTPIHDYVIVVNQCKFLGDFVVAQDYTPIHD